MGENLDRRRPWARSVRALCAVSAIGAIAAALVVYYPVLRGEFLNFDDRYLYLEHLEYRGLDLEHIAWMFRTTRLGHYAPLTWISAAIDSALFGLDPRAFHRTSLLLHAANTALFAWLARELLAVADVDRARAHPSAVAAASAAAAALFALHPLRVESVAWITERRGLLGAFFFLIALLAWLRAYPAGRTALVSKPAYALALVALAASLLSKGLGMSFAAIVVVLDVYPLRRLPPRVAEWGRRDLRAVWIQKIPVVCLGVASAVASAWAARSAGGTVRSLAEWGVLPRIEQAAYGLAYYLRQTVLPEKLSAMHELPYRFDPLEPRFFASALAVGVLTFGLMRARRPAIRAAASAYALSLLPVLGFAQAGPQLVADRYSYVACMPWAILAGGALFALWTRRPSTSARVGSAVVLLALCGVLSVRSRAEIAAWHDSRALWEHVLATGEPSAIAHNNLGAMDKDAGAYDAAFAHLSEAVAIRPDLGQAWLNLGIVCEKQNRWPEALEALLQARKFLRPATDALVELGSLYVNHLNRPEDGVAVFREAVAEVQSLDSTRFSPLPYLGLGVALLRTGQVDEGRKVLEFASQFPETRERALRALRL